MFVYGRAVSFMDLYINGIKCGNIGVLRQKLTEEGLYLCMELCAKRQWDKNSYPAYLAGNGKKKNLTDCSLKEGEKSAEWTVPLAELESHAYHKLFLHPADNCYAVADLLIYPEIKTRETKAGESADEENMEKEAGESADEENMEETELKDMHEKEPEEQECDKWEMIKKKYPILYPFKGQGPYVSIKPVDLQLLKNTYHGLGKNTFLMHGFYRYRHMILGEYSMDEGTYFYVGVPGEFVKKEQSTAAMCGFEGYEHSGDLGYYLYRVEI